MYYMRVYHTPPRSRAERSRAELSRAERSVHSHPTPGRLECCADLSALSTFVLMYGVQAAAAAAAAAAAGKSSSIGGMSLHMMELVAVSREGVSFVVVCPCTAQHSPVQYTDLSHHIRTSNFCFCAFSVFSPFVFQMRKWCLGNRTR